MNSKIKQNIKLLIICIAIALVVYSVISSLVGIPNLKDIVTRFSLRSIITIVSLSILAYGCRFVAWHLNLVYLGAKVPLVFSLQCYFAGYLFLPTPARAGTSIRAFYLHKYVPYSISLIALFLERINDLTATILFSILLIKQLNFWLLIIIITLACCLLFILKNRVSKSAKNTIQSREEISKNRLLTKIIPPFISKKVESLLKGTQEIIKTKPSLFKSPPFLIAQLLFCVAYIVYGLILYNALTALGVDISVLQVISIYSISVFFGSISFLPVGLGGAETVMIFLLSLQNILTVSAVTATLFARLCTVWLIVLIGLLATITLAFNQKNHPQV